MRENNQESSQITPVVERNIQALLTKRREEEKDKRTEEYVADHITRFAGSMVFVYFHLFIFAGWVLLNSGWLPGPKFDPSLTFLAIVASVEAIFLSTFVLITQNRMAALAEKRAELALQINLLTEHEMTRLITLVIEIAEQMNITASNHPELAELMQDIHPEEVLDVMEKHQEQAKAKS